MKKYQDLQIMDINLQRFRKNGIFKKSKTKYSDADLAVLYCIRLHDGVEKIKLTDIANKLGLTLPAITHKVNDLESRGLIIKNVSEFDKRIVNIDLTQDIIEYLDKIREEYFMPLIKLVRHLGEEDVKTLNRLLEKANLLGKV